jgi:hypothetical protein
VVEVLDFSKEKPLIIFEESMGNTLQIHEEIPEVHNM